MVVRFFFNDTATTEIYTLSLHDSLPISLREYGIRNEPRILLENVNGLELIEMENSEECCGFGGTFAVKFESISVGMVEKKVENALATKADYIVSTDLSCLMHMEGYIKKNDLPIKVKHIVDVLAGS